MKKFLQLTILFAIVMGLSACSPKEPVQTTPTPESPVVDIPPALIDNSDGNDLMGLCIKENGNWVTEYTECEGVGKNWCDSNGGTFNECASACRHNPDAKMCTKQCVIVCQFGNKPSEDDVTLNETIKQLFADKYSKPLSEILVTVSKSDETHAKGDVKFGENGIGEGGLYWAAKTDGVWKIVFDGNGIVSCSELDPYSFPTDMTEGCLK